MNKGITAFETKPVVMAVRLGSRCEPRIPTPGPVAMAKSGSGHLARSAVEPDALHDHHQLREESPLEVVCRHMDTHVFRAGGPNGHQTAWSRTPVVGELQARPFIPMLQSLLRKCMSGQYAERSIALAASSLGVLSREQHSQLKWLCEFPSDAVPSCRTVDKLHAGASLASSTESSSSDVGSQGSFESSSSRHGSI